MKNKEQVNKVTYRNRLSLTLVFALLIFAVLLLSIAIFVAATFTISKLGWLEADKINNPDIITLIIDVGLISIAVGFIVAMLTLKYPLKPFNQIITQMNRLAAGDFKARLHFSKPIASHPAFKETADSFNKMAEDLEGSQLLRSDFINNISHEFKTPIVSIAGFAKLLKRDDLTDDQKKEYINIIEEESLRLASMATNVLNLTKVENQSILTEVSEFNLTEQIRSCLLLLENKWAKKNIEPFITMEELQINANEELLKQVWINLLDNAIKFAPESTEISIGSVITGNNIRLSIKNQGEIAEEYKSKIFNRFYQADESHSKEGNGVGLAIVKKIVELHNGNVDVKSEDGFVEFLVTLPKAQ
ncbi:MAG: HAMP domain-containing histidine kinase [Ruminococcaceae bacterium]|nr:HAMP domain-containing histidine kinase [Oscillospiraceae bacterium]